MDETNSDTGIILNNPTESIEFSQDDGVSISGEIDVSEFSGEAIITAGGNDQISIALNGSKPNEEVITIDTGQNTGGEPDFDMVMLEVDNLEKLRFSSIQIPNPIAAGKLSTMFLVRDENDNLLVLLKNAEMIGITEKPFDSNATDLINDIKLGSTQLFLTETDEFGNQSLPRRLGEVPLER